MLPESNLQGGESERKREKERERQSAKQRSRDTEGIEEHMRRGRESERSPTQEGLVLVLCSC